MRRWAVFAALLACSAACNYGAGAYSCTTDEQCGASGRCEPDRLCSVPSSSCESGRAYADLSGSKSGTCVGADQAEIDASVPKLDARLCYGSGIVQVCLAAVPTKPFAISGVTVFDTGDPSMCTAIASGGNYCVVAATTITISEHFRASGPRPLVLLATDSITTTGLGVIDVGSHRALAAGVPELGAGAEPTACGAGTPPTGGGGGAGGSFAGLGGTGGNGQGAATGGGIPAAITAAITELRGGCPGQAGQGAAADAGASGHGGGAVFLIAGNKIEIGGGINAAGEGGGPGVRNSSGGGGGGSGGMIGLDAPTITVTSLLLANGGGGGEGSGQSTLGDPGDDPTTTASASGGAGRTDNGGDGGNGSAGAAAGPGTSGLLGTATGGGGGGGGGAGIILAPAGANLGTQVSPLATPS